jgi:GNAT superfamily N-acetyltransferase
MKSLALDVRPLAPHELHERLDEMAALRMEVFAAYPYLYAGDVAYERRYLRPYLESTQAVVVAAIADGALVGMSTAIPMEAHANEFAMAFVDRPEALDDILYCAESVLLPGWRGRGVGHRFFDVREDHGRALGRRYSAFCSVVRPPDHPARPADYRPLDGFWRQRGYQPLPGVSAVFRWRDLGEQAESGKRLQFWMKVL